MKSKVWDESGRDEMSDSAFFAALGFFIVEGLLATAGIAKLAVDSGYMPTKWHAFGIFILAVIGILVSISDNWVVSLIGYHMVCVPFGWLLAPMAHQYSPHVLQEVFLTTAGITGVMALAGVLFPQFFSKIGGALSMALWCLVGVYVIGIFFAPAVFEWGWLNWFGVGLFSLYIGFDMWRASSVPNTLNNAVDIAIALYLDIINLFIHLAGTRD